MKRTIAGALLVATPFVVIAACLLEQLGWERFLMETTAFGISVALAACFLVGIRLVTHD